MTADSVTTGPVVVDSATPDRFARRALGVIAPIAPVAMAGWALTVPYTLTDEPAVYIPALSEQIGRTQLAFWMMFVVGMTGVVGAIVTGLVARRGSRRLGTAGLVVTFLAFATVSMGSFGWDGAAVAATGAGMDVPTVEAVLAELETLQAPAVAGMFPLLFMVGGILLGIALWRGRTVPRWSAGALVVAVPVVWAGAFSTMAVNALGWVLMAVGFGAAGAVFGRVDA